MISKRDNYISFFRILSMMFIFGCHTIRIHSVSQFLHIGVQMFFIISGFLYGQKEIKNVWAWLCKRYLYLFIPIIIFVSFLGIYIDISNGNFDLYKIFIYIFGLEGVNFLQGYIDPITFNNILYNGTYHLWFITVLMICYLLTALVNFVETKIKFQKNIFILCFVIVFVFSLITPFISIYFSHIIVYFLGYIFSRYFYNYYTSVSGKQLLLNLFLFVFGVFIKLLGRHLFDETILYNDVISPLSFNIITIALLVVLRYIFIRYSKTLNKIMEYNVVKHLDKISYYFYIVHYAFLIGPLFILHDSSDIVLFISVLYALLLSILSAEILMFVSVRINKVIVKYINLNDNLT